MKKKLISTILAIGMAVSTMTGAIPVCADDGISVVLNGQKLQFEVQPQIINDYTMVPMRAIFESLGYQVEWNGNLQRIAAYAPLTDLFMILQIGDYTMLYGDYTDLKESEIKNLAYMDISPQIVDGSTLVPVRAISEASGCEVQWDSSTKTVQINTPTSIKENTEKAIKYYLIYNYNTLTINGERNIMRYRVYKNNTNTLPFDYNIAIRTSEGIGMLKTIKLINTISDKEKQHIINEYQNFEETLAKDLINQMPMFKFLGSYANDIGDKYSYMNWSNFGDIVTSQYNKTKAGEFTWAHSYDYGTFDFNNYFENVEIDVPCTVEESTLWDEVNILSFNIGNLSATKNGSDDDYIYAEVTIEADASSMIYMNCYNKKGRLLRSKIMSTVNGKHTTTELLPKNTARISFSNKNLEKNEDE